MGRTPKKENQPAVVYTELKIDQVQKSSNNFKIVCRILSKSEINPSFNGKMMMRLLVADDTSDIQVSLFEPVASKLFKQLVVGNIYSMTFGSLPRGSALPASMVQGSLARYPEELQLTINAKSEVIPMKAEDVSYDIPKVIIEPLNQFSAKRNAEFINAIGIVSRVYKEDVNDKGEKILRDISIKDQTLPGETSVEVTIGGKGLKAISSVKKDDVICITGGQKQEYHGFDVVKIGPHGGIEILDPSEPRLSGILSWFSDMTKEQKESFYRHDDGEAGDASE